MYFVCKYDLLKYKINIISTNPPQNSSTSLLLAPRHYSQNKFYSWE